MGLAKVIQLVGGRETVFFNIYYFRFSEDLLNYKAKPTNDFAMWTKENSNTFKYSM